MLVTRSANARGKTELSWLTSWHTFSFGQYYHPEQMGFSCLRVINDDQVAPGGGFAPHSHQDMEIFTYVLAGALEHKDSMGNGSVIRPGDVQLMQAGRGIQHSEFNHSKTESVHFLQIWILPAHQGSMPAYQQAHFPEAQKRGQLALILSADGASQSLQIDQAVKVYAGLLDGKESINYSLTPDRVAYLQVAKGQVTLNNLTLNAGDGVQITDQANLHLQQGQAAEVLLFDLPALLP